MSTFPRFAILHAFTPRDVLFDAGNVTGRSTVVHRHRVFRYHILQDNELTLFCNEFGAIIALQPIDAHSTEEADAIYDDEDAFDNMYRRAKSVVSHRIGIRFKDFDFCFRIDTQSDCREVSWNIVRVDGKSENGVYIIIEALFVMCLCSNVESAINDLPEKRNNIDYQNMLMHEVESLFSVGKPSSFLVNGSEIALMDDVYRAWEINQRIEELKERFGQAITNMSFIWEYREKKSADLLNALLAMITVLSLFSSADLLRRNIPYFNNIIFERMLMVLSVLIVTHAMIKYVLKDVFLSLRWWWRGRRARRRYLRRTLER